MAYVYADMDALAEYQQKIVQTLSTLEGQVGCKESLIEDTKAKIRAAIERAGAAERTAQSALYYAQEMLSDAERITREYNSNLQPDQEPMTTPEYYYERVADCELEHVCAKATYHQTQDTLARFEEYVRKYERQQLDGLEHFKKLLEISGNFFERYIKKLIEAKKCTTVSTEVSSARSNVKSSGETNYDEIGYTLDNYVNDIRNNSDMPETIPEVPIRTGDLKRVSPEENAQLREIFSDPGFKKELKRQWETANGREWPKYAEDVFITNSRGERVLIRKAGSDYDAHHIHPLCLGGKNEARNLTPLRAEVHFDHKGVHAYGSPFDRLTKMLGGIE